MWVAKLQMNNLLELLFGFNIWMNFLLTLALRVGSLATVYACSPSLSFAFIPLPSIGKGKLSLDFYLPSE